MFARFFRVYAAVNMVVLSMCLNTAYSQWKQTPLSTQSPVYALAAGSGRVFAGIQGEFNDGGVYLSSDTGATWSPFYIGTDIEVNALLVSEDTMLIGVNKFAGNQGIIRTSDLGAAWDTTANTLSDLNVFSFAANDSNVYAGTENGISFSSDFGVDWTSESAGFPVNTYVYALATIGNQCFAGIFNSTDSNYGVWCTTNNGDRWSLCNIGLPQSSVQSLAVLEGADTFLFAGLDGTGIYRSTNRGATWLVDTLGLTCKNVFALYSSGGNLFAGTTGGVFLSTNAGGSWSDVSNGLADSTVYSITVLGNDILAGTATRGVWRRPLSELVTSAPELQSSLPMRDAIVQAFPNPFMDVISLRFTVHTREMVSIDIFNALGKRCATIVNGMEDVGTHTAVFSGAGLQDGIYFYRMNAGHTANTGILELMR